MPRNWDDVRESLEDEFTEAAEILLEGAYEDMRTFVAEITKDMADALQQDRPELLASLRGQLRMVAEKNRVSATNEAWFVFEIVVDRVSGLLISLLAKGIT